MPFSHPWPGAGNCLNWDSWDYRIDRIICEEDSLDDVEFYCGFLKGHGAVL
ncbi:hypothetical protein MYP_3569 [Sporocytophaga myxococcoides]|uniref:Uncharacterized protein n=1 Tax=Sporocytophaga myxococcoides TaxID=153721 RepID=A0A098LHC5_9BACT|nr:hypothetical protein MYP_3569 [Sporocytophaga myxococcoides]